LDKSEALRRWEIERRTFIETCIVPRLHDAACQDQVPALLPWINQEIESRTLSPAPSIGRRVADFRLPTSTPRSNFDDEIDASQYGAYCAEQLRSRAWSVQIIPSPNGRTTNILAERAGQKAFVQCRRANGILGIQAVQDVSAEKDKYAVDSVALVSNAQFSRAAQQLSSANGVRLLDHDALLAFEC
jgi:hypothetical protein